MDGTCLCGAVTVTTADKTMVDACHCGMCRRWGGSPALGIPCGTDVQIDGIDHLKVYKSSDWAERAFCRECGTHIFYRLSASNQHFLPAGLFGDGIGFEFKEEIYIDNKPSYYDFANPTVKLTEADVMAKFMSGEPM
jgi:hypothetical protein